MAKKKTESTSKIKKKTTTSKKTESAAAKKASTKKNNSAKSSTKKISRAARKIEVISPTKQVKKIRGYSKAELEEFKKVILEKREQILENLNNLREQMMDPSTGEYVNENSPYSLHMAEQGTDAMEREKLYLWAQRENKFLGYLEDALARIENGTYGICIECIDEPQNLCPTCPLIPKERLLAVPHTQHCLQVKQKMQNKK